MPLMEWALKAQGVPFTAKCYGTEGDNAYHHVFHCNIRTQAAKKCNDDECAFFSSYLT